MRAVAFLLAFLFLGGTAEAVSRMEFSQMLAPRARQWENRGMLKPSATRSLCTFLDLEAERDTVLELANRFELFRDLPWPQDRFSPEEPLLRSEAASILERLLVRVDSLPGRAERTFLDCRLAEKRVFETGLLAGFPDGTFRPSEPLSAEQLECIRQRLASFE